MLSGVPTSGCIGIGRICILKQAEIYINKGKIKESQIEEEITRLEVAIDKALFEICDLSNELRKKLEKESNLIFEAYKTILSDRYFIKEIRDLISTHKIFAENAVDICIDSYVKAIEISDNDYVKQSMNDIRDVGNRIIRNIIGGKNVKQLLDEVDSGKIIAVKCITPWLAAALGKKNVTGIVCEEGAAKLSHSAIILRGLNIPAVNSISYDNIVNYNNDNAIIDANEGFLIIEPDKEDIDKYRDLIKNQSANEKRLFRKKVTPICTVDGHRVSIMANIGNTGECDIAKTNNADGIGLVRTEILFINYKEMPDEKGQYSQYLKLIRKMRSAPVTIRTVDASEDKIFTGYTSKMSVTKEGLRGIGYSLSQPESFTVQIRAVLRAARIGNVRIMFPMVNSAGEMAMARELIDKAASEMDLNKKDTQQVLKIGAVIESRKSIHNIDEILDQVDFISIGTNDLIQQIMGMNRSYSKIDEQTYLNPDFLKTIQYCIQSAKSKEKPVSICGEMASDPVAAVLLVGMGIDELSMNPVKIKTMKEFIKGIRYSDAQNVLQNILNNDIDDIRSFVEGWFKNI